MMQPPIRKPRGMAGPLAPEPVTQSQAQKPAGPLISPEFGRQMAALNRPTPAPQNVGEALHGLGQTIKQQGTLGFLREQDQERTQATNDLYTGYADANGVNGQLRGMLAGPGATSDTRRIALGDIRQRRAASAPLSESQKLSNELKRQQLEDMRKGPDPLDQQMKRARLEALQRGEVDPFTARTEAATNAGLQEGTPEHKSFVLTGKLPDAPRATTADRERAKLEVKDQFAVQQLNTGGQSVLNLVDQLDQKLQDPQADNVIGQIDGRLPNIMLSTQNRQRRDQIVQDAQAINSTMQRALLKGGGSITESERASIDKILGDITTASDAGSARKGLENFKRITRQLFRMPDAHQRQQGPEAGHTEEGFTFQGGDPADPNNWVPAQ